MPEAAAPRPGRADRARALVLLSLAALWACSAFAVLVPDGAVSRMLLGLVLLAPLALTLPGVLRRNRRAYAWATLCLTPHFVYALTELVANPVLRTLAATMLVLGLVAMVALVAYLRLTRPARP
jgi:uncharacterized membrane protein